MSVLSIRLNTEEEKVLNYLSEYFDKEKSTIIKHSLYDLYEDLLDREAIKSFEKKEKSQTVNLISSDELLKSI